MKSDSCLPYLEAAGLLHSVELYFIHSFTRDRLIPLKTGVFALIELYFLSYIQKDGFQRVLSLKNDDSTAALFLERADKYLKAPPPGDWDGVEVMTEK